MKKSIIITVLFCWFGTFQAISQNLKFFDVDNELSSSLINFLYQDKYGLMWVATEEGLNCYDGNKFKQFRHNSQDPQSLCSNYVNSLFESDCGKLFVCTNRGIQVFDPSARIFEERIKDYDGKDFSASVVQIINRGNGDYWVIGDSLRIIKKPRETSSSHIRFTKAPVETKDIEHIHCGASDNDGNIWLSLSDRGLLCITPENRITNFFGKPGDPSISCMTLGNDGLLYLGTTSHGLLRYNPDNFDFERLSPATGKEIKNLYVEKSGEILQATDGTGIVSFDPRSGKSQTMYFGNRQINSDNTKTHCILRDNFNNLWLGLFQTGVLMIPEKTNAFEYLGGDSDKYDVIGNKCVSAICKDSSGTLWIGADNDGIYALNPDYSQKVHFYNEDISVPMCIFEDSQKNLWVGTYLSGVGKLNRTTGEMKRIMMPDNCDISLNMCFAITEDRDHNIWLGTLHTGLIRYNPDSGSASIDFPWREKINPFIASLYYSGRTNNLYIGTYSGLQIVSNLSHKNADVVRLLDEYIIHSIDESPDGLIWIGTTNGLVKYNPMNHELTHYGVKDGLPSSTIYAVRCEGKNIWMSLNSGISRLDVQTGKIATFFVGDGLQANEYYKNSVFKDESGHIYFGGTGGITHFDPNNISNPGREWNPRIVDLYAHGLPLQCDPAPYSASKFKLGHDENTFSVEFGTEELGRPQTVRFAYSIDGKPWELLPQNTNTVNFYDLDPGNHTLSFKAIDGFTQSPVKSVSLAVAHPWYSSPWSIVVYIVLAILILWSLIQSYLNRLHSKAQLLELKHSDQLNEARLRSYVNISHEIRTPMSLVISPLQKLLANDDDVIRQREYRIIMRNAKRVLRLIDELMDLRKIEKHQMTLSFKETPLVPFIQDICDTFAQVIADKKQTVDFTYADPELKADVDTANFDKILMNLFSNAVKYTPEGGRIHIDLLADNNNVFINISDTGIGISDDDKKRIFERFYQVQGNTSSGTGVGLHLTQQLVNLHGGIITVSDNIDGKGSCFTIKIPKTHSNSKEAVSNRAQMEETHLIKEKHKQNLQNLKIPEIQADESKKNSLGSRILIVEDDKEIKQYLNDELSKYYKIETCSDGKEALEIIFKNPPDLILSDIMMPGIDGLELTKTVKQNINLNHIPVILLTALTRDEDNINAITAGADSYFTKPFNIEIIKERIGALLQRYRELKNLYSGNQEYDEHIDDITIESSDEKLIRKVVEIINKKLGDPDLSVEKLAWEVGLSRVHLHRKLKELTNQSPSDFIRNTRLRQAAHLLKEKKLSIAEVAYATGFNSTSTFSVSFKKFYGVTPSAYAFSDKS